jgi:glycosyltransferase involved in cell wall biosynthesis
MKLGIISDCIHIRNERGEIGSHVHIYVKQIDFLSEIFEETIICAPVIDSKEENLNLSYYSNKNISFIALPKVGGDRWQDKLTLLRTIPTWIKSFSLLTKKVDLVYQRFPNNLNIPGFIYTHIVNVKKFATYTGVWKHFNGEERTIRLQRLMLKYLFKGPVFVYDFNLGNKNRIKSSFSPSYSRLEWENAESIYVKKLELMFHDMSKNKIILLNVASLVPHKNQQLLLEAAKILKSKNREFILYIAGKGIEYKRFQAFIEREGLSKYVILLGHISQMELVEYYKKAHFVIQPPKWEGYGKVPLEAMLHSAIPILSSVNLHPSFVGENMERGGLFDPEDPDSLITTLDFFIENPNGCVEAIKAGRNYSKLYTLEKWREDLLNSIVN